MGNKLVLFNATTLYGGVDLSGQSNNIEIKASATPEVSTTFASAGWEENTGTLKKFMAMQKGFWWADAVVGPGEPDQGFFNDLGALTLYSATVTRPQVRGDVCYFGQPLQSTYTAGMQVGKLASFQLDLGGDLNLVRGQVLDPSTQTTTGTGTGITLPAVAAGQSVFAGIQLLSVAGTSSPSLAMTIQSDATGDAWASPTTRFTFPTLTAYGWAFMALPGPITDTGWRTEWTITGTTPSFTYAVVIGIS